MKAKLVTENVWVALTAEAKRSRHPAYVAVAYFGQGAAELLPLLEGSRLVVDASEAAVKGGQTCPGELEKMIKRGVRVYSVSNLHAKIFVFGTKALIGSANVSRRSQTALLEAMLITTDRNVVADARGFVKGLCLHELGSDAILRLAGMYRPPRIVGGGLRRALPGKRLVRANLPRVRINHLVLKDPPEKSESVRAAGKRAARERMARPKRHEARDSWHPGTSPPYRLGEVVLEILDEGHGRRFVLPPGNVVHIRKWGEGRTGCTFTYLEVPRKRRMSLERFARKLGRGARKHLDKKGLASAEFSARILQEWNR